MRDYCVIPAVCRWHPAQTKISENPQVNLDIFTYFCLRKVRDSNPRYDVMRTPHFECGSFDHSDNFPKLFQKQDYEVKKYSNDISLQYNL